MKIKYRTIDIQEVLDHFMVKLSSDFSDDVRVLSLNETSKLILTSIQDGLEEEDIVKKILDTYNVDEETAKREVAAFISQLKESGIVK